MSRSLKYDIPGPDRCVLPEQIAERGWRAVFAPELPAPKRLVVDLGFGRGEFLLALAERDPDTAFLGIELSYKRVLKMRRRLARSELGNVRVIEGPAEMLVREVLPEGSVARFWINCPDPWPKKRHHRRRLLRPAFVRDAVRCLEAGGELDVATDHADYAEAIAEVLAAEPELENLYAPDAFRREVPGRPPTAYEREWRAEGRCLHFFRYARVTPSASGQGALDPGTP